MGFLGVYHLRIDDWVAERSQRRAKGEEINGSLIGSGNTFDCLLFSSLVSLDEKELSLKKLFLAIGYKPANCCN